MTSTQKASTKGGPEGSLFSRVVLVGGGHAHLELIRSAAEFERHRIALHLVDPGDFNYSGGASAVLGGSLRPEDNRIDLADLCSRFGVTHHRARAERVDARRGVVHLDDGQALPFDRLSLDIGSRCRPLGFDLPPGAVEVKPIAGIEAFRMTLVSASQRSSQAVLVIGGGASAVELAGNLLRRPASLSHPLRVTLVSSAPSLLADAGKRAGRIAADNLHRRGATIHLADAVAGFPSLGVASLASGRTIAFDHLLLAAGLEASTTVEGMGERSEAGYGVDETLAMRSDPRLFAVGDCAAIAGHKLPKLGVYGVRAAPSLRRNLIASLEGRALEAYQPQARALSILDLGDWTGLALRGGLAHRGRLMLWWKRRIDRRFLDRYRP